MEHPNPEDLITTAEAARLLGVSPVTMYSWRRRRKGPPCYRLGSIYRYDRTEVLAYLRNGRLDPAVVA